MSENVQDDDQKNAPTDNGESDDGGESPVIIEEAESTQPSPESGQGSPHSPDSTMAEGGAQATSSTNKKLVPGALAKDNPMLVNVLTGKCSYYPAIPPPNSGGASSSASSSSSSSSRQAVPDSPSRRKRESDAPAPEPPFSPTKKLKSPKKDNKSPNKDEKK